MGKLSPEKKARFDTNVDEMGMEVQKKGVQASRLRGLYGGGCGAGVARRGWGVGEGGGRIVCH